LTPNASLDFRAIDFLAGLGFEPHRHALSVRCNVDGFQLLVLPGRAGATSFCALLQRCQDLRGIALSLFDGNLETGFIAGRSRSGRSTSAQLAWLRGVLLDRDQNRPRPSGPRNFRAAPPECAASRASGDIARAPSPLQKRPV
jgi:hypothetical protein